MLPRQKVRFFGRSIHPGYAKGKMVNALTLACEFQQVFPVDEVPEKTDGKRALSLEDFSGDIEQVELTYLIRDFDEQNFAQRKAFIKSQVEKFNAKKRFEKAY